MKRALVTGGGGFLGGAIARALLARGWTVRALGRGSSPRLESLGVEWRRADVADRGAVGSACEGVGCVFHVAAKVGLGGPYEEFSRVNVGGTRAVVEACRERGVPRLVLTSSPSVVFDGGDVEGWDESAPYPKRFDSPYSRSKAIAEELALAAAGRELAVVALRPHLVWGPGDNHILPRLLERARAGRLRRIKGFDRLVDTTYIDDAVEAHLLAADCLELSPSVSGRAYFISQGDPRPLWSIIAGLLRAAGVEPALKELPRWAALAAAAGCEGLWRLLGRASEPPLTRFLVRQLSTAHWFDISAARAELGYRPSVTIEEGLRRLAESLRPGRPAPATRGTEPGS